MFRKRRKKGDLSSLAIPVVIVIFVVIFSAADGWTATKNWLQSAFDNSRQAGSVISPFESPNDDWDKSSITVSGACNDPDAVFTITNISDPGQGDMAGPTEYRLYRNDVIEDTQSFQLAGGESLIVTALANGDSIHLEADQRPGHPGNSHPQATVSDCGQPGDPGSGPVAADDSVTAKKNNPKSISILDNDFDPDTTLTLANTTITNPASHGRTSYDFDRQEIVYTPHTDFYGYDNFTYEVCDETICDQAVVTIKVLSPPNPKDDHGQTNKTRPVILSIIENDEDPDGELDLNSISIIKFPDHGQASINHQNGSISYSPQPDFTGFDSLTYQVCDSDKLCENAIVSITVNPLGNSEYKEKAPTEPQNNPASDPNQPDKTEITFPNPIIGTNQFILGSQKSPILDDGSIIFAVNQPQTIFIEVLNADQVEIIQTKPSSQNPDQIIPLRYNDDLHLWQGRLGFYRPGNFNLTVKAHGPNGLSERPINTARVIPPIAVSDQTTNQAISNAAITVFYKSNEKTGGFEPLELEQFGQANPFLSNSLTSAFIAPAGEIYVKIEHPDYSTHYSQILKLDRKNYISFSVQLSRKSFLQKVLSFFKPTKNQNNFELASIKLEESPAGPTNLALTHPQVKAAAYQNLSGSIQPIIIQEKTGSESSLLSNLPKRPTLIFVINSWSAAASEQRLAIEELRSKLDDKINLIAIDTLEEYQAIHLYDRRGNYQVGALDTSENFFTQFNINSLPHLLIFDQNRALVGSLVGPHSTSEIEAILNNL